MQVKEHRSEGRGLIFAAPLCAIVLAVVLHWCLCSLQDNNGSPERLRSVSFHSIAPGPEPVSPSKLYPREEPAEPVELLIVPEWEEWLLPIAVPLVGKLRHAQGVATLVAVSADPTNGTLALVKRLSPRRSLVLSSSPEPAFAQSFEDLSADIFPTGYGPMQAGIRVAESFWGRSSEVVVAYADDSEAVILGSLLAANLGVPLIPLGDLGDGEALSVCLARLGVQRILAATADATGDPSLAEAVDARVEFLGPSAIYRLVLGRIGKKNVQNIVLARAPRSPPEASAISWMAPYLGLLRRAPVVLCESSDAREAEQNVWDFVNNYGLKPRTVTILADYSSIGVISLNEEGALGDYEVDIEPCSFSMIAGAAAFGVGRIPCHTLEEASVLIARAMAWERLVGPAPMHVLMVANPGASFSPLPLCETISRATAEEFKNFRVKIDEFYGKPSGDPEISRSACGADLIIYEGHLSDQQLFEDPLFISDPEYTDFVGEEWDGHPNTSHDLPDGYATGVTEHPAVASTFSEEIGMADEEAPEFIRDTYGMNTPFAEKFVADSPSEDIPMLKKQLSLDRMPLLVFQSCHSLEEPLARQFFQSGGIGIMGSTTNVHSASGSAFVKAFCDGLLYRGDTVGEAMRDARNYFICLAELKAKRGHKEQAKVFRAALSFRLWGDPELRIPHYSLGSPTLQPVLAIAGGDNHVLIRTPLLRLPECGNDKYLVRMFPGSQLAGVVKRLKERPLRRLAPMYFFRLPMPEGFATKECLNILRDEDTSPRATFLADPLQRFLYVLYFPEKVKRRDRLLLQFRDVGEERSSILNWEGIEGREIAKAGIMDNDCSCPGWCSVRCDASQGQARVPPGTW